MRELKLTFYKSDYYGTWIVISSRTGFHTFPNELQAVRFMRSEVVKYGAPTGSDQAVTALSQVS